MQSSDPAQLCTSAAQHLVPVRRRELAVRILLLSVLPASLPIFMERSFSEDSREPRPPLLAGSFCASAPAHQWCCLRVR